MELSGRGIRPVQRAGNLHTPSMYWAERYARRMLGSQKRPIIIRIDPPIPNDVTKPHSSRLAPHLPRRSRHYSYSRSGVSRLIDTTLRGLGTRLLRKEFGVVPPNIAHTAQFNLRERGPRRRTELNLDAWDSIRSSSRYGIHYNVILSH